MRNTRMAKTAPWFHVFSSFVVCQLGCAYRRGCPTHPEIKAKKFDINFKFGLVSFRCMCISCQLTKVLDLNSTSIYISHCQVKGTANVSEKYNDLIGLVDQRRRSS